MRSLAIVCVILSSFLFSGCETFQPAPTSPADFITINTNLIYAVDDIAQVAKELDDNVLVNSMNTSALQRVLKKHSFISELPFTSEILVALPTAIDTTNILIIAKKNKSTVQDTLQKTKAATKGIFTETYASREVYQTQVGDYVLVSPQKEQIEKALAKENKKDTLLEKILLSNIHRGISTYTKNNSYKTSQHLFSTWNSLDITLVSKGIKASGVAIEQDSLNLISAFKGQKTHPIQMEAMIPSTAKRGTLIGYSNAALLYQNINKFKNDSTAIAVADVFETIKTIGQIELNDGTITILESLDSQLSLESLSANISEKETYRDIVLYSCNTPNFVSTAFNPLLEAQEVNILFSLDNFIIGANSQEIAEQYITTVKTNNTLAETAYYKNAVEQLPTHASFVQFEQEQVAGFSNTLLGTNISEKKASKFPIAIKQYHYDNSFAHINFICQKAGKEVPKTQGVSQLIAFDTQKPILGTPTFFTNHKSKEKELLVQDIENKLHLYALNGNKVWTRAIKEPILGEIHEVDLLRNGKKQMAFVTKNKIHVLDRNGKDLAPFPISFKDDITQPLAVFDYDSNRKYRFVIVQDNEIIMLDSKGKTVKGFTLKKTNSSILGVPQHIRLQNKDYLLFQQENGTLSIVSRTGKTRVTVSEKLKLTGNPIQKTRNSFVLVTQDNEQKTISQKGKVSTKNVNTANDFSLDIVRNNSITLTDNQLKINNKYIELPFGIYTKPTVYFANKKGYVAITETQENKLYLYDFKGNLYKGFPVYGTSAASLIAAMKKMYIATKETESKVVVYLLK